MRQLLPRVPSKLEMKYENRHVVLPGHCGPNALKAFGAAGIKVVTGVSGLAREAVGAW